ncbi:hypothetical protein BGX31_003334 [Mortierella sp. GBA43]|nr:hypothetical protein BGX31_003334 [Mortierella sp. GBA43]
MSNVFKSFGGLLWGDSTRKIIIEINSGQFRCTSKGRRQILYPDAKIAVNRLSQPFVFQLKVYRVEADGDDEFDIASSQRKLRDMCTSSIMECQSPKF